MQESIVLYQTLLVGIKPDINNTSCSCFLMQISLIKIRHSTFDHSLRTLEKLF